MKRTWTNDQLKKAVKSSCSFQDVARQLGLSNYGANSRTIKKYVAQLNIDTSHFLSKIELLNKARQNQTKLSIEDIFCINNIDRKFIKKTIISYQLITYKCCRCNIAEWQGETLSLHLDHINGINNDNRLDNLRFLCPNCHSLTPTYCGKQFKNKIKTQNKCCDCGSQILDTSTRCVKCNSRKQKTKIIWPDTSTLKNMVKEYGYRNISMSLGVSDSAIKKRIMNH